MSDTLITIPLCQLKRSNTNVRKTEPLADIEQMAASIASQGVLENLVVHPLTKEDGKDTGSFEVIAGGRRLAALKLLVKRKVIKRDHPIPCRVIETDDVRTMIEVSLTENEIRAPIHPADQFEAFSDLQKKGLGAEDIAARFGLPVTVVLQRFKLAAVSPKLMTEYRAGKMNLDQLMAFTVSDDHKAQEEIWFDSPYVEPSPQTIRRLLTKALVEGRDRRARFIGVKLYEEAGGIFMRDLFRPEEDGYFTDSQLLDRLVAEKLAAEAEVLKAEGWSWVEAQPETDFAHLARFGQARAKEVPLSDEDEAKLQELADRYDSLVGTIEDETDEEASAEIERLTAEMDALEAKKEEWPDEEKARAGAILSVDANGLLRVSRGLLRPGDRHAEPVEDEGDGEPSEIAEKPEPESLNYPAALLLDLSTHRTAALRETLACEPDKALSALLYTLVLRLFFDPQAICCVNIKPVTFDLGGQSETIGKSKVAKALLERRTQWLERLPEKSELWSWLEQADLALRLELLAYCVALTVDGLWRPHSFDNEERQMETARLAESLGLDMAKWWRPSREEFFTRITKAQILEAVAEGVSPEAASAMTSLNKADMAKRAEELLSETQWLPALFRNRQDGTGSARQASASGVE